MKTFGKKLMSLTLALVFVLSLATVLPVGAEGIVTAVDGNGAAVASGSTIPAVGKLVFTLPNAIEQDDLTTAVTFFETRKGKAATTSETPTDADLWSDRVYKTPVISGNTLTFTFGEGDLALNSEYRFTFAEPAVTGDPQHFTFKTNAKYTDASGTEWYMMDNFSRYPELALMHSTGSDVITELDSPWWLPRNRYSNRVRGGFVTVGGTKVLQLEGRHNSTSDNYGSVGYDNAYSPAYTGAAGQHRDITEVEFSIAGNPSSIFEVGGIIIRTDADTGKTGLYVRKTDIIQGTQSNTAVNSVSLNYEIAAPSATMKTYKVKFITSTNTTNSYQQTFEKIWFDKGDGSGYQAITLPDTVAGITFNWQGSYQVEEAVDYNGVTGIAPLLSATNSANGDGTTTNTYTTMNVYSYKYGTYVTPKTGLTASKASGTIDDIGSLTYTFDEPMNKDSVLAGTTLYEWNNQYDADLVASDADREDKDKRYTSMYQWNKRDIAEFASMSEDGKVLTLSFDEGDLAANGGSYKVEFADTIVTAEGGTFKADAVKTYSYTTQQAESDTNLLYDNFERYPVGLYAYGERYHYTSLSPIANGYGYKAGTSGIVLNENDKGLKVAGSATGTASLNYDTSFAKTVSELPMVGVVEVELDMAHNDNETAFFDLGGALVVRKDGTDSETGTNYINTTSEKKSLINYGETFGLYARVLGYGCNGDTASTETFNNMVRLSDATTADFDLFDGQKHTVKYVARYFPNTSNEGVKILRKLLAVYIDGHRVETAAIPASGLLLSSHSSQGLFFKNSLVPGTTRAFGTASFKNGATAPYMTIYSLKSYIGETVTETESLSGGSFTKSVTITDYTGAEFGAMVAFLATYSADGKTLVDVKPATVTLSDSNKTATITGTATATVGGKYKLILLNSEAGLQPVREAFAGTIQ